MLARSIVDIEVRSAGGSDLPFVVDLADTAFREYDRFSRATITAMSSEPGSKLLLAVRGQERVGFIVLSHQSVFDWAVNAVAVIGSERGKGVGRRLMGAAERYARSRGARKLRLCTAEANLAALDLFLRSGFAITQRNFLRYHGGQPACLLEKRLARRAL